MILQHVMGCFSFLFYFGVFQNWAFAMNRLFRWLIFKVILRESKGRIKSWGRAWWRVSEWMSEGTRVSEWVSIKLTAQITTVLQKKKKLWNTAFNNIYIINRHWTHHSTTVFLEKSYIYKIVIILYFKKIFGDRCGRCIVK